MVYINPDSNPVASAQASSSSLGHPGFHFEISSKNFEKWTFQCLLFRRHSFFKKSTLYVKIQPFQIN